MTKQSKSAVLAGLACLLFVPSAAHAQYQSRETDTIAKATGALNDFMSMPNQGVPTSMIQRAQGLVIVPGMLKVGFVVGGRRGKGIAVVRDANGAWKPPTFVTMTGGSVGFQAGIQSTDVLLVFNSRHSVDNLLSGKFTIGGDVSAAAGPIGREASAATDARLKAEIYSYSRARGLFAGAAIDGSVIQMDVAETQNFYRAAGMSADGTPVAPNAQVPLAAAQFLSTLANYSGAGVAAPSATPPGTLTALTGTNTATASGTNPTGSLTPGTVNTPGNTAATGVYPPGSTSADQNQSQQPSAGAPTPRTMESTRLSLAQSAQGLGALLDESWRQYLSLPQGVFSGTATPTAESLRQSLLRFDAVAKDNRYALLQQRNEFQQTYGMLRTYYEQVQAATTPPAAIPSASTAPGTGARGTIR